MNQPEHILKVGTRVTVTKLKHATLGDARSTGPGEVVGPVGGHGGDVYWVSLDSGYTSEAYCFDEFELEAVRYVPRVGDLLVRYGAGARHTEVTGLDGPNRVILSCGSYAYAQDLVGSGWRLAARGTATLAERESLGIAPTLSSDTRSEVERLREEVAMLRNASALACRNAEEAAAVGYKALAEQEERGRPDVAFAKGVRDERRRVLEVLRGLAKSVAYAAGWRRLREVAEALGFTPDELSAEREVGT